MAWVAEGLLTLCLVILGYGICWLLNVRPLRRTVAAQNAAVNGGGHRAGRDHAKPAERRLPDPAGTARVAGPLPPQDQAIPAGAVPEPIGAASHGPQAVAPGMVYFERLEFSIAAAEPPEAETRFRIAVKRDLVPYSNPEAVTQRAAEDSDFRERLAGMAADYFVRQYGDPVVAGASRQVWVTRQSFPETDLAGICGRVSDRLETIVAWPLTDIAQELGIPAPVNAVAAGVGAGLILDPVTGPLEEVARLCEIVGVGIGLLTGCHPLALASAKMLAKSEIHEQMARGIVEAGKLVFRGELPPQAEPGVLSAAEEPSRDTKSSRATQPSRESYSRGRPEGVFDPGLPPTGWDGSRPSGVFDPGLPPTGWDGSRAFEEFREPGPVREPRNMAVGRPDAHEQREEPGPVREPHRSLFWVAGLDEDEPGRDANRNRDDDDWGRGERAGPC